MHVGKHHNDKCRRNEIQVHWCGALKQCNVALRERLNEKSKLPNREYNDKVQKDCCCSESDDGGRLKCSKGEGSTRFADSLTDHVVKI